jgi:hypothetical protein
MFAQAAPAGSRLLTVRETHRGQLKAWATRGPDGTLRVVAINKGGGPRTVAVRLAPSRSDAELERLQAPRLTSRGRVTLGGQSFGSTTSTGRLAGRQLTFSIASQRDLYVFNVPAGSASLVTIPPG